MNDSSLEAVDGIDSYHTGQKVSTSFGTGVISAISYVDSIVYVAMSDDRSGLYLLRPQQIRATDEESGGDFKWSS